MKRKRPFSRTALILCFGVVAAFTILVTNNLTARSMYQKIDNDMISSLNSLNSFTQQTSLKQNSKSKRSGGGKEKDDVDDEDVDEVKIFIPPKSSDKSRVVDILSKAGVTITQSLYESLPTWTDITSLYGSQANILGLDTCETFRSTVPSHDVYLGPAGLFNTGTNLLDYSLHRSCQLVKRRSITRHDTKHKNKWKLGTLFQVPWGKHNPAPMRLHHKAKVGSNDIDQTHVLPVVMIKDPYHWMKSMCRTRF